MLTSIRTKLWGNPRRFLPLLALSSVLTITLSQPAAGQPPQPVVPQPVGGDNQDRATRTVVDGAEDFGENEQPQEVTFFGEQALEVFLRKYQEISGKIIIWSPQVQQDQTIKLDAPPGGARMTPTEQLELIEQTLLLNGYTLIEAGENSVKLINWRNENPRVQAPPVFGASATLPGGENLVTYFMTFDNIAAADAQTVFTTAIPRSPFGEIALVPNINGLLITENTEVIRRFIELKDLIDVPSAQVVTEFVELERADAERVAETIRGLLEEAQSEAQAAGDGGQPNRRQQQQQQQQQGAPPTPPIPGLTETAPTPSAAGGASGMLLSERGLVPGEVKLIPDPRTNSILVVTRPSNLQIIVNLIKAFDRPIELELPYERQLYYRKANEILPILVNVLTEEEGQSGNIAGGGATGGGQASNVGGGRRGGQRGGGDSGIGGGASLQGEAEVAPESVVVGKTLLIADNTSNSILISGPQENIDKVDKIISRLDIRGKQVYLSTVIGQLTLGENTEFGINYLQKFAAISNGNQAGGVASHLITSRDNTVVVDPRTLVDADDFADVVGNTNSFRLYGTVVDAMDVFINLLQTESDFKIISRPNVFTANNEPALILSGSRVPVPTQTITDVDNNSSINSSIGFEDVVLSVEIVPLINANREVTLEIYQQNDTVGQTVDISGNDVPQIDTQELQTTVTVPDRSIVVLGGLINEQINHNVVGFPLLKDIPLLGHLFKSTSINKTRRELIIMVQPTVIETEADLYYANYLEQHRNRVAPESRDILRGENPEVRRAIPVDPNSLTPPSPAQQGFGPTPRKNPENPPQIIAP